MEDREVRTLAGKRVHQIIKENGHDNFPECVKDIGNKHYTIQICIKEMNVVDNIQVYSATNICNGFKMPEEETTQYMEQTNTQPTSSLRAMSDANLQSV